MVKIKSNYCLKLILFYLSIPTIIFLLSFVKAMIGIPVACVTVFIMYRIIKANDAEKTVYVKVKKSTIVISALIIIIWCFLGGQGGLYYQSDDWFARNAVFHDLLDNHWPVYYTNTDTMLSYYIGHWLFPALIGKILLLFTGNAILIWRIANIALWLWTAAGICIFLWSLWIYTGAENTKLQLRTLFILIFFSGLDAIGVLLHKTGVIFFIRDKHIEWWAYTMQFSSNTTCLFWVFNQAIPAWIATIYMLMQFQTGKSIKQMGYIVLVTLICSPLPCVGLFIYSIGYSIFNIIKNKKKWFEIEAPNIFSLENILSAVFILPPVGSYLFMNASFQATEHKVTDNNTFQGLLYSLIACAILSLIVIFYFLPKAKKQSRAKICFWLLLFVVVDNLLVISNLLFSQYIIFLLLEIGIYLIVLHSANKDNVLYYLTILSAAICPLIRIGYAYDFCMRASIPAIIFTMTMCIDYLNRNEKTENRNRKVGSIILTILIILGSVTPLVEFNRGFFNVIKERQIALVNDNFKTMDQYTASGGLNTNFVSEQYSTSIFYKYFVEH